MNERLREALRRKIEEHNKLVTLSSLGSFIAVVLMWVALYFVGYWLCTFFGTVVKGVDATLPQQYPRGFAIAVAVWLLVGWIARRAGFFRVSRTEQGALVSIFELLLSPTRATFGMIDNMRNSVRLSDEELIAATDFLVRLVRAGKLAEHAAGAEFAPAVDQTKILLGLQLLNLVYLRKGESASWITPSDPQRLLRFL